MKNFWTFFLWASWLVCVAGLFLKLGILFDLEPVTGRNLMCVGAMGTGIALIKKSKK